MNETNEKTNFHFGNYYLHCIVHLNITNIKYSVKKLLLKLHKFLQKTQWYSFFAKLF